MLLGFSCLGTPLGYLHGLVGSDRFNLRCFRLGFCCFHLGFCCFRLNLCCFCLSFGCFSLDLRCSRLGLSCLDQPLRGLHRLFGSGRFGLSYLSLPLGSMHRLLGSKSLGLRSFGLLAGIGCCLSSSDRLRIGPLELLCCLAQLALECSQLLLRAYDCLRRHLELLLELSGFLPGRTNLLSELLRCTSLVSDTLGRGGLEGFPLLSHLGGQPLLSLLGDMEGIQALLFSCLQICLERPRALLHRPSAFFCRGGPHLRLRSALFCHTCAFFCLGGLHLRLRSPLFCGALRHDRQLHCLLCRPKGSLHLTTGVHFVAGGCLSGLNLDLSRCLRRRRRFFHLLHPHLGGDCLRLCCLRSHVGVCQLRDRRRRRRVRLHERSC